MPISYLISDPVKYNLCIDPVLLGLRITTLRPTGKWGLGGWHAEANVARYIAEVHLKGKKKPKPKKKRA